MTDISKTLEERGGRYGAFINHATIAQGLQEVLHEAPNWSALDPDMRQAICVICDKIARILNGDPYYEDNWHDIQGYAKLVETRILEIKKIQALDKVVQEMTQFEESCGGFKGGLVNDEIINGPSEDTNHSLRYRG